MDPEMEKRFEEIDRRLVIFDHAIFGTYDQGKRQWINGMLRSFEALQQDLKDEEKAKREILTIRYDKWKWLVAVFVTLLSSGGVAAILNLFLNAAHSHYGK